MPSAPTYSVSVGEDHVDGRRDAFPARALIEDVRDGVSRQGAAFGHFGKRAVDFDGAVVVDQLTEA